MQRIYTGNLPTGEHRLDVSMAGKLAGGRDFAGARAFQFSKDVEPKLVDITLAGAGIQFGGWPPVDATRGDPRASAWWRSCSRARPRPRI